MLKKIDRYKEPCEEDCLFGDPISLKRLINRLRQYKNYWHAVNAVKGNEITSFDVAYYGKRLYSAMFRRDVSIREFRKHFAKHQWGYEGYYDY